MCQVVQVGYEYIVSDGSTEDTLCFFIDFVDNTPPVLNYTVQNTTVDCGMADYNAWWNAQIDSLELHGTDNCGIDTVYHSGPDNFIDNCGMVLDTFFVADTAGNISIGIATYTITDTTSPSFTSFPADLNLECDDVIPPPSATVMVTDDCAASVTPIYIGADTTFTGTGACMPYQFEIKRTWRVTDGCNAPVDSVQTITVSDTSPPDFTVPPDTTVACGTPTDIPATGDIFNLSDNCTPPANLVTTISTIIEPGSCTQNQIIKRTWKVMDACDNEISKTQTITVIDTIAPTAVFPANITVACFDANDLSVTGQPTSLDDNCDPIPSASRSDLIIAGSCQHSFTVERTWTITDACTNATSMVQIITVKDTVAPVINNEAVDQTVTCDVDINAAFNNWISMNGAATATDNCTVPADSLTWMAYNTGTTTMASLAAPDCVNPTLGIFRTTTVDFIVIDKCGNSDTTTATFNVADNDPPVLVDCPSDITVNTDPGECFSNQTLALPLVMENCGNTVVAYNQSIALTPSIPSGADPIETPINDLDSISV